MKAPWEPFSFSRSLGFVVACCWRPRRNPAVSDKGAHRALFCFCFPLCFRGSMTYNAYEIVALLAPTVRSLGLKMLRVDYLPSPGGRVLRLYTATPGADHRTAR